MLEMHLICILKKYLELQPDVRNIVITVHMLTNICSELRQHYFGVFLL